MNWKEIEDKIWLRDSLVVKASHFTANVTDYSAN